MSTAKPGRWKNKDCSSFFPSPCEMADSSNPQIDLTATLPCEILRDILHRATFIPHEWDMSATVIFRGLFCSWDEHQLDAWEELLPLRITITRVSRRWRAVGLEFLYGSFHETQNGGKLESFASLLSLHPYYGMLVKRLTIQFAVNSRKHALIFGISRCCPNLLIVSAIDNRNLLDPSLSLLSDPSIFPMTLKQLDINVVALSISSISALLTHLPQLEILLLSDIGDLSITNHTKIVLPRLRILQLVFLTRDDRVIVQLIERLELPLLSAMCIGVESKGPIPALPKNVSERLEDLGFCFCYNTINAWEAVDFRNLCRLRLHGGQLSSTGFCFHLPMKQIVELTCRLPPDLTPGAHFTKEGVVGLAMNSVLDPSMMPKLHTLRLDLGEVTWNRVEKQMREDKRLITYFEALVTSFDQQGIDLWFNQPHFPEESVLVRDMIHIR
jgi:hypothetical protein